MFSVGACSTQVVDEPAAVDEALSAPLAIRECRLGANNTAYAPGGNCQPGLTPSGTPLFYGAGAPTPGVSSQLFLCVRPATHPAPAFRNKFFVTRDGTGCEGGGSLVGPIGVALDGALCGARQYNRFINVSTGESRISPAPSIAGFTLEGPVGYFFDAPVNDQQCCLSDRACGTGTVCRRPGNACEAGCRRDNQCGSGQLCEGDTCVAGTCRADSACGATEICEGRTCRTGCRDDNACPELHKCNLTSKTCE